MWTKLKRVLKDWGWAILLALAWLIGGRQSQRWAQEKEREIKDREKKIDVAKEEVKDKATTYEEAKQKHDAAIEQAQAEEGRPSFTDSDSAASFIDDILDKRK